MICHMHRLLALVLAGALMFAAPTAAQDFDSELGTVRVTTVADGLEFPWGLAFLPDGRMLVTERPGRLRLVGADGSLSEPLAGVPEVHARGQGGLLDVALDPDFASNRRIYLAYAEQLRQGAGTAVSAARLGEDAVTEVELLFRQEPKVARGDVHFGSRLVPDGRGHLFITLGDRNQRSSAQSLDTHHGAVVRVNTNGLVPDSNPFTTTRNARAEIWSYGHRNVQGAALHPVTGELWTHEHGPRGGDEINIARAGNNYGWPVIGYGINYSGAAIPETEGTEREGMEQPLHMWNPSIAPSGMAFYTHDRIRPWNGQLFVGALAGMHVARLELDGESVRHEERLLTGLRERIRDVRAGPDGYLYLLTDSQNGRILRVDLLPADQ